MLFAVTELRQTNLVLNMLLQELLTLASVPKIAQLTGFGQCRGFAEVQPETELFTNTTVEQR